MATEPQPEPVPTLEEVDDIRARNGAREQLGPAAEDAAALREATADCSRLLGYVLHLERLLVSGDGSGGFAAKLRQRRRVAEVRRVAGDPTASAEDVCDAILAAQSLEDLGPDLNGEMDAAMRRLQARRMPRTAGKKFP